VHQRSEASGVETRYGCLAGAKSAPRLKPGSGAAITVKGAQREIAFAASAPASRAIHGKAGSCRSGPKEIFLVYLVRASSIHTASNVAVETENPKAVWIAGATKFVIDSLVALAATMFATSVVDVIKRKKCGGLLPAARARWRLAAVCAEDISSH
jgi:hypothetical protein